MFKVFLLEFVAYHHPWAYVGFDALNAVACLITISGASVSPLLWNSEENSCLLFLTLLRACVWCRECCGGLPWCVANLYATSFRERKQKTFLVNLSQKNNSLMKKAPSSPEK